MQTENMALWDKKNESSLGNDDDTTASIFHKDTKGEQSKKSGFTDLRIWPQGEFWDEVHGTQCGRTERPSL